MSESRVVVYVDYQNVQYCARDMFWRTTPLPRTAGHIDPLRFGNLLCDLGKPGNPNRVLAGVRVYRCCGAVGPTGSPMGAITLEQGPNRVLVFADFSGLTLRTHGFHNHIVQN